jgi:hypothetical protein
MKNRILSLATLVMISLIAFLAVGCSSSGKATEGANEYVSKLYPGWTVEGIVAKDFDTDQDGYVSTDVRIKNPTTGEEKMLNLDCAKVGSFNSGCKQKIFGAQGK